MLWESVPCVNYSVSEKMLELGSVETCLMKFKRMRPCSFVSINTKQVVSG